MKFTLPFTLSTLPLTLLTLCTVLLATTTGMDTLSGPLPKIIKAKSTPYYILANIEVPPNKTVTIEPGVVFVFKNFTGLHVEGRLQAKGTKANPIVFTSEFNQRYNPASKLLPNPYDWNGVYIHESGFGTILTHCRITYTVYGLISESKFIRLEQITCLHNGKMNLKIESKEYAISDKPYNYNLSVKDVTKDGVPIDILKDPLAPKRNTVRYSGLAVALGGIGLGVYSALQLQTSWPEWVEINKRNDDDYNPLYQRETNTYPVRRRKKNQDIILTSSGAALAIAGIFGFTWSFTF